MSNQDTPIYTRQFWLLCISSLLFFASFNMLIPELPAFLSSLGGASYKGLIISLFTLTAMVSRPFSGKLADNIGRMPVMVMGALVCMVCSLMYPILSSLFGFFMLRLVHGFSTGFTPTGQSAYVSDIIPANRRGEAMGILGTIGSLGMAAGPPIGGWITREFGINFMFYLSSSFGLIAGLIVISMKETLTNRQKFRPGMLTIRRADLFEPRVWLPCVIMALAMYAYGSVLTLIPDFGEHVGIQRRELLFTCFMISSLLIRMIAGKASDRYGRVPVLIISTAFVMVSMFLMSVADSKELLIAAVFVYGFAQGSISPTLLAWATDLSESTHRGRALASLYIFMELGIGMGALLSGLFFGDGGGGFFTPFFIASVLGGIALAILSAKYYLYSTKSA